MHMHLAPRRVGLASATFALAVAATTLAAGVARAGPPGDSWGAWPKVDTTVAAVVLGVCPTKQACDTKDPATGHPFADDTVQLIVSGSDLHLARNLGKLHGDFTGSLSA